MKVCPTPGCPTLVQPTAYRGLCPECARKRDRERGTTTERGYGAEFRATRAAWADRISAGERVICWRCEERVGLDGIWTTPRIAPSIAARRASSATGILPDAQRTAFRLTDPPHRSRKRSSRGSGVRTSDTCPPSTSTTRPVRSSPPSRCRSGRPVNSTAAPRV